MMGYKTYMCMTGGRTYMMRGINCERSTKQKPKKGLQHASHGNKNKEKRTSPPPPEASTTPRTNASHGRPSCPHAARNAASASRPGGHVSTRSLSICSSMIRLARS